MDFKKAFYLMNDKKREMLIDVGRRYRVRNGVLEFYDSGLKEWRVEWINDTVVSLMDRSDWVVDTSVDYFVLAGNGLRFNYAGKDSVFYLDTHVKRLKDSLVKSLKKRFGWTDDAETFKIINDCFGDL